MLCRALAGRTHATSADSVYDEDDWDDREYVALIQSNEQTAENTLNWVRLLNNNGVASNISFPSTKAFVCARCTVWGFSKLQSSFLSLPLPRSITIRALP